MFEITVLFSILCGALAIIFSVRAVIFAIKEKSKKSTKYSAIAALFNAVFSFSSYQNIVVPMPDILPLNNETETYIENVDVTINSDKFYFLETYYTLNGDDPKFGSIYEDTITLTESATVCARCKFLWKWSEIKQRPYIITENDKTQNTPSTDEGDTKTNDVSLPDKEENEGTEPLKEFPFRIEYEVRYPEAKEINFPTPEESGTYSLVIPLDLRGDDYKSEKVPQNADIHGFIVNDLYYCSDDNSVTDVSAYNYYKFADYWLYLHTIDLSFTEYDGFDPDFNGATIVLQEKESQKKIVLSTNYLDGQFVQFKCSTGQYIIEVQKGGIAYTGNLNISKNEKQFLALSPDDYYYLSSDEKDSYIEPEEGGQEAKPDSEKGFLSTEAETIPEKVLATVYEEDVQLLMDAGKYLEAADLYKSKITYPTPADWCNVGDILNYYIGDYDQAALYYSICLQNDPSYDQASEGLEYAYAHGGSLDQY